MAAAAGEGADIPCFGLTSPEAGSDAASMVDTGIIARVISKAAKCWLKLNWHKRYITLGPVRRCSSRLQGL